MKIVFFAHIKICLFYKTAVETHIFQYTKHMINVRMLPLAQATNKTTESSWRMKALYIFQ